MSLEEETKKAMGFNDSAIACSNCASLQIGSEDNGWEDKCLFSNLCTFKIENIESSSCHKYEERKLV